MIYNKTLFKLLDVTGGNPEMFVKVNDDWMRIIPDDQFSPEEIEELRDIEEWFQESGNPPSIANFLPDDVRPAGVKKL